MQARNYYESFVNKVFVPVGGFQKNGDILMEMYNH